MNTTLRNAFLPVAAILGLVALSTRASAQGGPLNPGPPPPIFTLTGPINMQVVVSETAMQAYKDMSMTLLVNVLDGNGKPVVGIYPGNFQLVNYALPLGSNCGPVVYQLTEIQPGLYYVVADMPQPKSTCKWVGGDYLSAVTVSWYGFTAKTAIKISIPQ
jgi:hypothetical protein